jgi:hypothetical protein
MGVFDAIAASRGNNSLDGGIAYLEWVIEMVEERAAWPIEFHGSKGTEDLVGELFGGEVVEPESHLYDPKAVILEELRGYIETLREIDTTVIDIIARI